MPALDDQLYKELYSFAWGLFAKGNPAVEVEAELKNKSDDPVLIAVVLKESRKDYHALMQKEGLQRILLGIAFAASGFLVTLFNFNSSTNFDYALFGFTTIGICFICWGLYKLIG